MVDIRKSTRRKKKTQKQQRIDEEKQSNARKPGEPVTTNRHASRVSKRAGKTALLFPKKTIVKKVYRAAWDKFVKFASATTASVNNHNVQQLLVDYAEHVWSTNGAISKVSNAVTAAKIMLEIDSCPGAAQCLREWRRREPSRSNVAFTESYLRLFVYEAFRSETKSNITQCEELALAMPVLFDGVMRAKELGNTLVGWQLNGPIDDFVAIPGLRPQHTVRIVIPLGKSKTESSVPYQSTILRSLWAIQCYLLLLIRPSRRPLIAYMMCRAKNGRPLSDAEQRRFLNEVLLPSISDPSSKLYRLRRPGHEPLVGDLSYQFHLVRSKLEGGSTPLPALTGDRKWQLAGLRAGGATIACRRGATELQLCMLGRWTSGQHLIKRYLQEPALLAPMPPRLRRHCQEIRVDPFAWLCRRHELSMD
jgi:hypothetical protein